MPDEKKMKKKQKAEETVVEEKKLDLKPDFKYIVRVANTDLDGKRPVVYALTAVPGIGIRVAESLVNALSLPRNELIGNLEDVQIERMNTLIEDLSSTLPPFLLNRQKDWETGKNMHLVGMDLKVKREDDINLLKMIRCYRGIRHEKGLKVRGQRTKSKGRKGLAVGVVRKKALVEAKKGEEKKK